MVDWLPTLASLAGLTYPKEIDGVDQWTSLLGTDDSPKRTEVVLNLVDRKRGKLKGSVR